MNKIIATENLQVGYDEKVVIDNVDIQGMKGQFICLLGPNGAGKSTILRTLTGLLAPVKGTVFVQGVDIRSIKKQNLAKKMAVVLTEQLSINMMTVFEIASMGRYPHTNFRGKLTNEDKKVIEEALSSVKALHLKDRYYAQLSDGEKQKIMIARALVQEPEIIVLDEPTSHLDVKHKVEVINILRGLCKEKGITVILSLHDIDLAVKGCEILLLLQKGKIVANGSPEEIISNGTIQQLYGIEGAHFSELMGSLEFSSSSKNIDVFILGGNGSGTGFYRAVAREGLGMCCGILHENDVDYYIAEALGCEIISEKSFEKISRATYDKALKKIKTVKYIIDPGFPLGDINYLNLKLIEEAANLGKTIFSLCDTKEASSRYKNYIGSVETCASISEVLKRIKNLRGEKNDDLSI